MADSDTDDPTISDDELLWRRIPKDHLVPDVNVGGIRISSAAFANDSDGEPMSVMLASMMLTAGGGGTQKALTGHATFGLASIHAGVVRSRSQIIVRVPLEDEPAHAVVVGTKSKSTKKALAAAAQWVVPPPGHVILGLDRLPPAMVAGVTEQTAWKLLVPRITEPPSVTPPPAPSPTATVAPESGRIATAVRSALSMMKGCWMILLKIARRFTTRSS